MTNHSEQARSARPVQRARRWMLTLMADQYDESAIRFGLGPYDAWIGQLEKAPKTGRLHFQIYLDHSQPIEFKTLQARFPTGHFEPARESRKTCVAYVTKDRTRAGTPISHGTLRLDTTQGKRSDLVRYADMISDGMTVAEVVKEHPEALRYFRLLGVKDQLVRHEEFGKKRREVRCHYIHGDAGVGKTHWVFEQYGLDYEQVYRVTSYDSGSFDGYQGQRVLLLDEFSAQFPLTFMNSMMDPYPFRLPARYENKEACFEHVYVLSNKPLSEQYLGENVDPRVRRAWFSRFNDVGEMVERGKIRYEVKDASRVTQTPGARARFALGEAPRKRRVPHDGD